MSEHDVTIIGLNRVIDPRANKGGSIVLAYFDCALHGLEMRGCAFVRTPRHGLSVWPPRLEGNDKLRRAVEIKDSSLRAQMTHAAQNAYRAMGGTDGEWEPRSEANQNAERGYAARVARRQAADEPETGDEQEGLSRFLGGTDG